MSVRTVLSVRGEAAETRVNGLLATYQRLKARDVLPFSRRLGRPARIERPEEIVYPHLVAIAEEFSATSLLAWMEDQGGIDSALGELVWPELSAQAVGSWSAQEGYWKRWRHTRLTSFAAGTDRWDALRAHREARNAIVHGLGRLTPMQRKKDDGKSTRDLLSRHGFVLRDNVLMLEGANLHACAALVKSWVQWIDALP